MKKQILSIVLAVSMLASLCAVFMLPAVAASSVSREVLVTESTVKVDGKCEDEYLLSTPIKSIYTIKDAGNKKLKFEGYALATKAGFYFWLEFIGDTTYVNTGDTNLHDYGNNNRDYLQVYYNMSAGGNTDYIGYIMHDYRNSVYFRNPKGTVDANGAKAEGYTYNAPAGFQSAAVKTETGWISEMFIPWVEGSPALAGMTANNLSTSFHIGFQYNDDYDGNNDYNCAVYDDNTTSYWSDYTLMPKVTFIRNFGRLSKTNVFLDGDIAIDYNVNLGGAFHSSNMAVRYTITGKDGKKITHTVKGVLVDPSMDTYNFSFGIAPHRMNDTIKVELLNNDVVIHDQPEYTVREFCINTLNSSQEDLGLSYNQYETMKRVATDMLNFGAVAQKFLGYNVNNLANAGYEKNYEDIEMKYDEVVKSKKAEGYDNIDFVSYNIYFDEEGKTRLSFKVKVDENEVDNVALSVYAGGSKPATVIHLTDENYLADEGVYELYTDEIDASDYDHNYIVRLEYYTNRGTEFEKNETIQSVKCSVNAYLATIVEQSSNAAMIDLAKAAYILGLSADSMSKA